MYLVVWFIIIVVNLFSDFLRRKSKIFVFCIQIELCLREFSCRQCEPQNPLFPREQISSAPTNNKWRWSWRILMSVTKSVILSRCEKWAEALRKDSLRRKVAAIQRRRALLITLAYRTVSERESVGLGARRPWTMDIETRRRSLFAGWADIWGDGLISHIAPHRSRLFWSQ